MVECAAARILHKIDRFLPRESQSRGSSGRIWEWGRAQLSALPAVCWEKFFYTSMQMEVAFALWKHQLTSRESAVLGKRNIVAP